MTSSRRIAPGTLPLANAEATLRGGGGLDGPGRTIPAFGSMALEGRFGTTTPCCAGCTRRLVARLEAIHVSVLKDPADMPWGERIVTIADPDGNPVAFSNKPSH
jgi:hypothetical protein